MRESGPEWIFLKATLRRDFRPLAFNLLGCAIASLVAVFQFAVFTSFLRAAYVVPELVGPSAWITGHGVAAFDFPYLISQDYAGLAAQCFPGASFRRVLFGFASWTSPSGRRGNLALVGFDGAGVPPRSFVVDSSDRGRLDLEGRLLEAEVGGITMSLSGVDDRLATFLGAPYAVVPFRDAARALGVPPERVSFIAIDAVPRHPRPIEDQIACARRSFPEVSFMTAREFNASSAWYWLRKTGAGAAILIASILATLLMLIILTNGVVRFGQRRHRDFVSILAVGAGRRALVLILVSVGVLLSFGSIAVALLLLPVADLASDPVVPWVFVKPVDVGFAFLVAGLGALAGSYAALRETRSLRLSDVFREA